MQVLNIIDSKKKTKNDFVLLRIIIVSIQLGK